MASGDLKYMEQVAGVLTTQQRTDLVAIIAAIWPGALADLETVIFSRNPDNSVRYHLRGEQTKAPANVPLGVTITGRVA